MALIYVRSYYEYDRKCLYPMIVLFGTLDIAAHHLSLHPDMIVICVAMQALAWFLQFVGHYVFEKNRPVLFKSLENSFVAAPYLLYWELGGKCVRRKERLT